MQRVLFLLGLIALVYCVPPTPFQSYSATGVVGNNVVYYSNTYFTLGNVVNPINIEIYFFNGTGEVVTAQVCLNSNQEYYPTPGNNINSCPNGGLATLTNSTVTGGPSKLKFTRKNSSLKGLFLSKMVEDDTNPNAQPVYVTPSTSAGFTVTVDSGSFLNFNITIYGEQCDGENYPINGDCQPITTLNINATNIITISANSTAYYKIVTPTYDSTEVNQLVITHDSPYQVLLQSGYLPTTGWYISEGLDGQTQTINTPGTMDNGEIFFIGLLNTGDSELNVSLSINFTGCSSNQLIGPGCAVNYTNSNNTDGSTVIALSATLSGANDGSNNGGSAWNIELSDSDNAFVYFQLVDLPIFPDEDNNGFPYYVRVSVGNTDLEDDDGNHAPEIFAKKNGIPSSESFDVSASGSVANQVILQVDQQEDNWIIAVSLPADFSIWVGVNCAGNCSGNEHGSCQCGLADGTTVDCQSLVNSTNTYPLYSLPVTTTESSGACDCSDSDYDNSFDCTQKSSPTVLFIVLIVIGGLIILFVAIGVPLYCYISNKRKERYERI